MRWLRDCPLCVDSNPEDWLLGEHLSIFRNQRSLLVSPEPSADQLPLPCYRVPVSEEKSLRQVLVKSGYSTLIP